MEKVAGFKCTAAPPSSRGSERNEIPALRVDVIAAQETDTATGVRGR